MSSLPITPATFPAHIAMMMPNVMPMQVAHGIFVEKATIAFGNPNVDGQQPLPELVDLPFKYGASPEFLIDPREYLGDPPDPSSPPPKSDFDRGIMMIRMPASKANFEVGSMARYIADENPSADRDRLIADALGRELTSDNPYSFLKFGYFLMCHSDPALRFQAANQLLQAGILFANAEYFSAAAMAYELAADLCESPDIGLGNADVESVVETTMTRSRSAAGMMWRASLQTDNTPENLKVRLYRGLYNAWHNPDRDDMAGLLTKVAHVSRHDGDALACADNYVRMAWSLTDGRDPAAIEWEGVADALIAGLSVWQPHPARQMHAEHMKALIEAARAHITP